MARIAVGGFQHETNPFAPVKATLADFQTPGAWPGLTRGPAVFEAFAGMNIAVSGFLDRAAALGHDLVPLLWCSAPPSAHVTRDAYETIAAMLQADLAAAGPLDALYLDLHGAMVCEHLADGEGELLARVRTAVGPDLPLVASLDFHANVSPAMLAHASELIAYRTYPHVDMAETGARAAERLDRRLRERRPLQKAMRRIPFLIPIVSQSTLADPARRLFATLAALEARGETSLSFAPGFPLADVAISAPTVLAYGAEARDARDAADALARAVVAAEPEFVARLWSPEDAVRHAAAAAAAGRRPVVLADTQDNPGAGGNADTTGLLRALVAARIEDAAIGVLFDPEVAALAHRAGVGAEIAVALGAKSGFVGDAPFEGRFAVEALGDGNFMGTGPFYRGCRIQLGPMARLRIGGVRIALASRKQQAADQAMFRHVGIEPKAASVLALKSSVHFRADFGPIAAEILVVEAPGPSPADLARLPYRRLARGTRIGPLGKPFAG